MTPLVLPFPNIGPDLFSIEIGTFTIAVRWYALAYIVGILLGWRLCVISVQRSSLWAPLNAPMSKDQLDEFLTWIILGIIVGGRLGFVLFLSTCSLSREPAGNSYGMERRDVVSWVDFLALPSPVSSFASGIRSNFFPTADLLALATPPGLLLGRLANFINGELWGRPTDVPWAVVFPGAAAQTCPEIAGLCARHPSQIYEALLEGLILGGLLLYLAWRKGAFKRQGLLTGVFLAGYGGARAFIELFRQPDSQFVTIDNPIGHALHFGSWGLTMGQLLSLPMMLIGVALIWAATATRPPKAPGSKVSQT